MTEARGPECAVCPICQLLAVLRTAQPEVFEHLSDASVSLVLALRAAIDASGVAAAARRRGETPVQHIDIDVG